MSIFTCPQHTSVQIAQDFLKKWNAVQSAAPFFTYASLLLPAERQDGLPVMLKIPDPNDDEAHGADLLDYWEGWGAVRLVERDGHVQLLERIIAPPESISLDEKVVNGDISQATHIMCDVIDRLHEKRDRKVPSNLIPLNGRVDEMKAHLKEGRPQGVMLELFAEAVDLSRELYEYADNAVLHGDIHHFNVMQNADGNWISLDPKGFWGAKGL